MKELIQTLEKLSLDETSLSNLSECSEEEWKKYITGYTNGKIDMARWVLMMLYNDGFTN